EFMRSVISKTIADFIYMQKMDAVEATRVGIEYLTRKVRGRGGVIVIDSQGRCSSGFTTRKMIHGWIEHGGESVARF
ncbi:MAG: isoaspartyl peptidase/L-asparaginase, partial [Chromatiales bacterium]